MNRNLIKNYYLLNPTGNITLLAEKKDEMASLSELPALASSLMELEPSAEQVGFLSSGDADADICLTMAGGEFCGNASLSAAAVFEYKNHLCSAGRDYISVKVKVSGADDPVSVLLRKQGELNYSGAVSMPPALSVSVRNFSFDGISYSLPAVEFQGITHLICEPDSGPLYFDREIAEQAVKCWCGELGTDALGIMQTDYKNHSIIPLVYVKSAGTLFWESSCASGTCAAGVYYADRNGGKASLSFNEPAGKLSAEISSGGKISLHGNVVFQKVVSEDL